MKEKEYESSGFPLDDLIAEAESIEVPEDSWERQHEAEMSAARKLKAKYLAQRLGVEEDATLKALEDYEKAAKLIARGG